MDYDVVAKFVDEISKKKDPYNHHGSKVADLCIRMASQLQIAHNDYEIKMLEYGARMHDVGKIFIDDSILNVHGRLTGNQIATMRTHVIQGFNLSIAMEFDPIISMVIRHHHENIDGSGYPDGLKGESIPFYARMIRVADTFDAMTSDRPYRKALSEDFVLKYINQQSGKLFDPYIVNLLLRTIDG